MCAGFPRYILKSKKFDKQGKGQDMCSLYLCFNLIYNVYNVFWACSDLKFDHNRTLKDLSYDGIFHMYTHLNCIFCAEAFKRSSKKKKSTTGIFWIIDQQLGDKKIISGIKIVFL